MTEYSLIIVPALYAVSDEALERLNAYVKQGGHAVYTFKSGFADETVKVRTTVQPGIISEACGIGYSLFVTPHEVRLKSGYAAVSAENNSVETWMELITPTTAEVLLRYDHPHWGEYAAVTRNCYGQGSATYIGCMTSREMADSILKAVVQEAGLWGADQELAFPLIVKTGINPQNQTVRYYLNYSDTPQSLVYPHGPVIELQSEREIAPKEELELAPWGVAILLEH
ncbi:beta-galactosidase trimerization domain-containing protein [Paenibacillus sonchi]|uniref:beta-galactosidase trimerization domain-containing protein n=1 Tax=Paenibacillus sonchi TaxID=373687 RepID=UPI00398B81A6